MLSWLVPFGASLGVVLFLGEEPRIEGAQGRFPFVRVTGTLVLEADTTLAAACRRVWGLRADAGQIEGWPTSFPEPPARARRCTARASTRAVYYVWEAPDPEILAHWEAALHRNRYRTQRVGGRTAGREFLRFAGPAAGKISFSPRGGGFVIVFGGAV